MVLGVTCSTTTALLTSVENGEVMAPPVYRIEVAALNEASAELEATLDEIGRTFSQIKPDLIVLLLPEQSPRFKSTYNLAVDEAVRALEGVGGAPGEP